MRLTLALKKPTISHCCGQLATSRLFKSQRQHESIQRRSVEPSGVEPSSEDEGVLRPEDDWAIPGNYQDAMSSKTELGKALRQACQEIDALSQLEGDILKQAEGVLKNAGFKGSIFATPQKEEEGEKDN